MSDFIDLSPNDDESVVETTSEPNQPENPITYTFTVRGVTYPNVPMRPVGRPTSRPLNQLGMDNVDYETIQEIGRRMVEPSVDSSSSENSMQWDTAQAAECEPTYTSSFQFFPYTSAKKRSRARYQRFLRTGSWDKASTLEGKAREQVTTTSLSSKF
jgi:hypothetical protein